MKNKLKIIFISIIFIICLINLFGCQTSRKDLEGKEVIEFWTISLQPAYNDYINGLIDEFQKENPHVVIEWVDVPINVMRQKLMAAIAGGVPPDVVNLNSELAQVMAQNKALASMDRMVQQEDKDLYFEGLWNAAVYQGENYAIPWYVTTRIVIYNREIFEKAGIDPNSPPRTWSQVEEYARKIKRETGIYGYMPAINFIQDLEIRGVPVVNEERNKALFNSPKGLELLQSYTKMYKDKIIPDETLIEGYQGAVNRYQTGQLGMLIAGATLLNRIKTDAPRLYEVTDAAPMPLGDAGVVPAAAMNLVVPISSSKKETAVKFALFVTNNHNQLEFCRIVPLLPSVKEAAEDEFFKTKTGDPLQDKAREISIEQLFISRDLSLGLSHMTDLNRAIKEMLEASFYNRMSPEEALKKAANEWDEILNR